MNMNRNVMINNLPQKMQIDIAHYVENSEHFNLFEESISSSRGNVAISQTNIHLVERLSLSKFKRNRPSLIVDHQNTSKSIKMAEIYSKYRLPFIMITPSVFHDDLEKVISKYKNIAVVDSPNSTPLSYFQNSIEHMLMNNFIKFDDYCLKIINSHSPPDEAIIDKIKNVSENLKTKSIDTQVQIITQRAEQIKFGMPTSIVDDHYFMRFFFSKPQKENLREIKENYDSLIDPFNKYLRQVAARNQTDTKIIPPKGMYQKGTKVVSNEKGIALTQRPVFGKDSNGIHLIGTEIVQRVYGKNARLYEILQSLNFLHRKKSLKEKSKMFSIKDVMNNI